MVQQLPKATNERRPAWFQRALRWASWLTFLGLAIANSQQTSFGAVEFLALAVAVGISIWCVASPLGPPKIELDEPTHVLGEFRTRINWALVLIGGLLTVAGFGGSGAIVHDLATGRASVGDVFHDIGIFVEGWFVEVFTKGAIDAELEDTRGYALAFLLVVGMPLLWINIAPLVRRGRPFRVGPDGSVEIGGGPGWIRLEERDFESVAADGTVIRFELGAEGGTITLGQARMFSREHAARLPAEVSAAFFRGRLATREFDVDEGVAGTFSARRA